ncbi:MAG: M16 family metallopeptidase [Planctomycetota bacterium]
MTSPRRPRWCVHDLPLRGGRVHEARARGGTPVWVAPLPGVARSHAIVGARFGSLDDRLPDGTRLPPGTAHLLEHQMFQDEQGDLFDTYARRGAEANAYTMTTSTCYLVGCREALGANLHTLLRSMAGFHGTRESLAREREIIGQEIALYADDASSRGQLDLLRSLYATHPVREDPAGTRSSIRRIPLSLLQRVHDIAYTPRNLVLVVAGDVDPEAVLAAADEELPVRPGRAWRRPPRPQDGRGPWSRRTARLPVARPQVLFGARLPAPGPGQALLRARVETGLLLDLLFGDGGLVQAPLFDRGLADEGFAASAEHEADHAYVVVGGDADDAPAFERALGAALANLPSRLEAVDVERARRRQLGVRARRLGRAEPTANALLTLALDGFRPGADLRWLLAADVSSLERRLRELAAAQWAVSVVRPCA